MAEEAIQRESTLMERIAFLGDQLRNLEEYRRKMEAESHASYFPNALEAILQKGHYGSYPGYNLQAGINDWNELSANVESSRKKTGSVPEIILADKGYAKIQEIEAVQSQKGVLGGVCSITRKRTTEKRQVELSAFHL